MAKQELQSIEITKLEAKALRTAIHWARSAEAEGTLVLLDYEKEAFDTINNILADLLN